MADETTGQFKCDCNPETMKKNHWPADGKCYQHFTQGDLRCERCARCFLFKCQLFRARSGPCADSLLFRLNDQTSLPDCLPPIVSSSAFRHKRSPFVKIA